MNAQSLLEKRSQYQDVHLFIQFQQGNTQAFDDLLKIYQAPLFAYLMKQTKNNETAEELFQDVFFKVVERRDQFVAQEGKNFKVWLFTIARNTFYDHIRRKKTRPRGPSLTPNDDGVGLPEPMESSQKQPDQQLHRRQLFNLVTQELARLSKPIRETFRLRWFNELSYEEISEELGCSINTTKSRMRYANQTLKRFLGSKRSQFVH